jgi:choline-sulfatase
LLDLAQAPSHQRFTGRSLAPFLQDVAPAGWRDEMHGQCNGVELYFTQRSVFTREFKYVFNGFDDDELYDLRADPHELVNLAAQPEHTRMKHDLVRRMWRFAHQEEDTIINGYTTVALAPWGPAEAFK